MLRLLKNYSPFIVLILIIAAFLMKLQALSHPLAPIALPGHLLFSGFLNFFNTILHGSAFGYTLLGIIMLLSQALYLNQLSVRHKLFSTTTYLPAFTYLLLTSLHPAFSYFSEPLLINWVMLIGLDIMLSFNHSSQPRKHIFNAGFIICLAALFQFPALGFLMLFLFALILLRPFNIGEWVVGLMGYLTPIYFFVVLLFLIDKLPLVLKVPRLQLSIPKHMENSVYLIGTITGLFLLVVAGSIALQQHILRFTINIRRSWGLIYIYTFISIAVAFIAVSPLNAVWLLAMPPLSLVIAHSFFQERTKRFSNFAFYFLLGLLIFSQLSLYK